VKPQERFTSCVESYRQYRPGYPGEIVALLKRECGLHRGSVIADVAAGTGLLAEIFLERNYAVTAVEPNTAMLEACEDLAGQYQTLRCIAGTAEATGLADHSVDLLTVGQAMHWFDLKRAREEFRRILRRQRWCAIVYNNRRMHGDSFHEDYEKLLTEFGTDYKAVRSSHLSAERLATFFAPNEMKEKVFSNAQELTLAGLEGRILSSSYMPQPGHVRYGAMRQALEELFTREQRNGRVRMEYECSVAYGQLTMSAPSFTASS
jgi:ubiquinone/menaquinone biosynthesis C-methylase UbiE